MPEEPSVKKVAVFEGEARIGSIVSGMQEIRLKPEDFSSPIALQMAISRIYEAVIKAFEQGMQRKYVAEVRFTDSLGNPVVFAIDLGEATPPFSKDKVKARITVELYEEEED
ncbi:MAG: hypothetical protein GXO09_03080 [Crenarchaeota archaeon]|nr:hypothetical protein [Thermoproteota archaeon]